MNHLKRFALCAGPEISNLTDNFCELDYLFISAILNWKPRHKVIRHVTAISTCMLSDGMIANTEQLQKHFYGACFIITSK